MTEPKCVFTFSLQVLIEEILIQEECSEILSQNVHTSKVKVKCTLVQAPRLCTGRTAHKGSRGIAVLYRH